MSTIPRELGQLINHLVYEDEGKLFRYGDGLLIRISKAFGPMESFDNMICWDPEKWHPSVRRGKHNGPIHILTHTQEEMEEILKGYLIPREGITWILPPRPLWTEDIRSSLQFPIDNEHF